MTRNLSNDALNKIALRLGTEPITIIEVDWIADGAPKVYADRNVNSIPGRILDLGDLDNVINVTGNDSSQEISVTLDDTDGTIKAIFDRHDVHKRSVRVYQWFDGLDLGDRFLLFAGQISSPIVWNERARTVSFHVVSKLEDKEIGFSAEEGDFPYIPKDLVGKPWPMIFGTCLDVPALQFNKAVSGTTLCGVGIVSGKSYHNAMPLGGDDQSLAVSLAVQSAQVSFLNSCRTAYSNAAFDMHHEEYERKADQLLDQANAIRAQMAQAVGRKTAQEACARAQRSSTVTGQGEGCNPICILGGEDFPQGVGLVLNIGGGRFSGHFDGDLFYITDRVHHENEAAAAKAYSHATTGQDCPQNSPPGASYDFQMKVPEGYGGAWVEGGYGGPIFVRDIIRKHGHVITTSPPTTRPSTNQVARHFWAEPGSRVTIASDEPIYYAVSIVPGTVLAVKAYKTFNHQRKLVNVPNDLWHVESRGYGPITAVMVVTNKPLSTIQDQGWEDDLYVTFQSDVGPNIIDILKYVIDDYTDLSYDNPSFEAVRPKLDPFPANFPILRRKNTLKVLQEIAFQARCALWISNGVFYTKYLPEEPDADETITVSDINAESGIQVELTPTEDIVTKMVVTWHLSWAEEEPNRIILRHNVAKYGTQEEEFDFYIYNQPDIVLKCATFWLIRLANTWKKVRFSTALNKLNLETFDTVDLQLGGDYIASGDVKAVVEQANYNSAENTVDFECWVPVRSGEMQEYRFAWPSQVAPEWTFPTDEEIEAGHAGGAGIGQGATGELPVGFTDLPDWGEGIVFVGGPNIIFRGRADWGDRHPTDVDFEPQHVIRTETYAEISVSPNPNPDLTLNYVGPDHIWSKSDIRQVHDLLKRICGDNEFPKIPDLWKQSIIDQINEAIDRGWCDCCEPILCPFGTELYGPDSYTQIDLGWSLDWTSPNYPWYYQGALHTMNWAPLINGMQVIQPGYQRAWWRVRRWEPLHDYYVGDYRVFPTGSSGIVDCNGKIVANMDTEGPLGMRFAPDGTQTLVLRLSCVNVGVAGIDGEEFDGKRILRCCAEQQDGSGGEEEEE